jgi:hypothetical protein
VVGAHLWLGKDGFRITKRILQDLADEYLADPNVGECTLFQDGQELVVDGRGF